MKRILSIALVGMFGTWTVAAQSSASVQGGASAQTQTSVQTDKSGAQVSGNGSASATGSARAGSNSAGMATRRSQNHSTQKRTSPVTRWKRARTKT